MHSDPVHRQWGATSSSMHFRLFANCSHGLSSLGTHFPISRSHAQNSDLSRQPGLREIRVQSPFLNPTVGQSS